MILTTKELSLIKRHINVIGVDEAGRGPLAGPIVAAAVALERDMAEALVALHVNDSKKTTPKKREQLFLYIQDQKIPFSVFEIAPNEIDTQGILPANISVLQHARTGISLPGYTIIDGRFSTPFDIENYEITVRADNSFIAVAAASIVAKVHRDRLMLLEDKKYPKYGFCAHKGYGTKSHIEAIYLHGPCEIHRKTFEPIKSLYAKYKAI